MALRPLYPLRHNPNTADTVEALDTLESGRAVETLDTLNASDTEGTLETLQ